MSTDERMLSRRGFLKGAAALAAGSAVVGLTGCSKANAAGASWLPEKWDAEADIIAIGAGGGGLATGIEARDQGLEVIVLEHQPNVGGNSAICNGGMLIPGSPLQKEQGIEDSPDKMYKDLMEWTKEDNYSDYIRLLADQQALLWDWLTGMGIKFKAESLLMTNGQSVPREHHVNPADVIKTLNDNAKKKGVDIRLNTKGKRLIQDPVTKRILGVEADADGQKLYFKARKGVVLSSGGYGRNPDLLNRWIFGTEAEKFPVFDALGQDGSGLLMAMGVGADTRHRDYIGMLTVQNPKGKIGDACAMYHMGGVIVNKEGQRFVNEAQGYTNVWTELNLETDRTCFQIWDQTIATKNASNASSYYSHDKVAKTGLLLTANTYEELAQLMGVSAENLGATMKKYNADVASTGRDSQFGREHLVSLGPAPFPLNNPPYYAFETTSVICCTYGGITQDAKTCEATNVFGEKIPGLYLAGNISGYSNMGVMPGTRRSKNSSGTGFGGALATGRYCAQQIAKLDNWDAEKA